jgi:hypothetical protein
VNAYLVDVGEVNVCVENLGELGRIYDIERVLDVVIAETRSKAQYLFWRLHLREEGDLHEYNYRTVLLQRDVPDDYSLITLWALVDDVAVFGWKGWGQ